MPPLKRVHIVAAFVLFGIGTLLYSWIIASRPLLGTGVAFASFVVAVFAYYGDANRQTVTRVTIIITLIYGVFSRSNFPLLSSQPASSYLTRVAYRLG